MCVIRSDAVQLSVSVRNEPLLALNKPGVSPFRLLVNLDLRVLRAKRTCVHTVVVWTMCLPSHTQPSDTTARLLSSRARRRAV